MAFKYFGTTPTSDWTANGSPESGHDFINQINESKAKEAAQEAQVAQQRQNQDAARGEYQKALQNEQDYRDIYSGTKASEGVDDAKQQYQKSLASVNATQSAMNTLPSSINAGSNVVLNANQRNAALGNQMSKFQNTLDYQTRQNQADLGQYQTALSAAQNAAQNTAQYQRQDTASRMNQLQNEMAQVNALYDQLLRDREVTRSIYGQMYDDEYKHRQMALEEWAKNLDAEMSIYAQDQETARNNARIAAQNYATSIQKYMADMQNEQAKKANASMARANDINGINQVYAQYKAELADLDRQTKDFGSYLFGNNSLLGSGLGTNLTSKQAKNLRDKGFEDYLYNQNPYLQKVLRENYSDLLGSYGIGG